MWWARRRVVRVQSGQAGERENKRTRIKREEMKTKSKAPTVGQSRSSTVESHSSLTEGSRTSGGGGWGGGGGGGGKIYTTYIPVYTKNVLSTPQTCVTAEENRLKQDKARLLWHSVVQCLFFWKCKTKHGELSRAFLFSEAAPQGNASVLRLCYIHILGFSGGQKNEPRNGGHRWASSLQQSIANFTWMWNNRVTVVQRLSSSGETSDINQTR